MSPMAVKGDVIVLTKPFGKKLAGRLIEAGGAHGIGHLAGPPHRKQQARKIDMSDITRIEPGAHFAAATGNGRTLYISGQVADTQDGSLEVQTREVLAKIDELLKKGGSSRSKLMFVTVLLPHIKDFADFNVVWDEWVDRDNLPARATYEARLAFPSLRIEIAAVAEIG